MARELFAGQALDEDLAAGQQLLQIDARAQPHLLQHPHQIFGADVARCARRKWTPAQPRKRRVEARHPRIQRSERVGEALSAGVVEMRAADARLPERLEES